MPRCARLLALTYLTLLLVALTAGAARADDPPVVAGTFAGRLQLTKTWVPGGWGTQAGPRTFTFGEGCRDGGACTATRIDRKNSGTPETLTQRGGRVEWSGSAPVACVDSDTGVTTVKHGFDYTYRVRLTPASPVTRDGVTYAGALRGTYSGTLAVNAAGRAQHCLVTPRRVPSETEQGVYTLTLVPLAGPKPTSASPPLAIPQTAAAAAGTMPAFTLRQSERQRASALAVAQGRRSSVPAALVTPSEAFRSLGDRLPQGLLLAALLGLLMIFPAQIFNSTYEDNHERIDRTLARLRLRRRAATIPAEAVAADPTASDDEVAATQSPPRGRRIAVFLGCTVAGTLLGGLLDPKFGANTASYALMVGLFLSLVVAVLVAAVSGRVFRSVSHVSSRWYLRAIPSALLVAVLCVVVSRVTHFEPGYLYGVLGGAVFAVALDRRADGRAEVAVTVAVLGLALFAWAVFEPVSKSASAAEPAFWLLSADAFLGALFIGGVEGLMFGLIPLRFLPGYRVRGWNWVAWGVLTALVVFTFVHVLLMPESGYLGRSTVASVQLTVALFGAFALASGVFWLYFRLRPDPASLALVPLTEEPRSESDQVAVPTQRQPDAATGMPGRGPLLDGSQS